jgi:hypothetical protein
MNQYEKDHEYAIANGYQDLHGADAYSFADGADYARQEVAKKLRKLQNPEINPNQCRDELLTLLAELEAP